MHLPRTWKGRIGLCLLGLIVIALIYPGIPAGVEMNTVNSSTEARTHMVCRYLRFDGIRTKVIDIQHELNRPVTITNARCYELPFG